MFDKVTLRVDLDGDLVCKFHVLKNRLSLKNNTEVVRSLINQRYAELQPDKAEEALEVPRA